MWQNRIFHLIGDSMVDKFSKVKHTGVIMGREFWGFWMGRAVGIRTGSGISDVQYTREWCEVGWGRVTEAVAGVGRNAPSGSGGKRDAGRYARIPGGVGMPGGWTG